MTLYPPSGFQEEMRRLMAMETPTPTAAAMRAAEKMRSLGLIRKMDIPKAANATDAEFAEERAERDALRVALAETVSLAAAAMREANKDGGEFDIDADLKEARQLLTPAKEEGKHE